MAKVMGFSGFSSGKPNKKQAQQFDVEVIIFRYRTKYLY